MAIYVGIPWSWYLFNSTYRSDHREKLELSLYVPMNIIVFNGHIIISIVRTKL